MLDIVFPTSTAVISRSKSSASARALAARLLSSAARFLSFILFTDENAVLGTAQRLGQAGCGRITEIEVEEDDGRVYVLNLTDQNGHVFHTVVDYKGYIGPIQDEEGNYLYAPIE